MKTKLAAILAITMILLWPLQIRSQQSQQPIKHFGYIGATTDSDLNRVRSYTDFTFVSGEYGQSIVDLSTRVKNNGMRGRSHWIQIHIVGSGGSSTSVGQSPAQLLLNPY